MPTLISNQNYAVRWDKTDCHEYNITNLSELYNAGVTITDKTGTWTESFTLTPEASNSVVVPGDGVFEVCAYLFDMPIELEEQAPVNGNISINTFPIVSTVGATLSRALFDGAIYVDLVTTNWDFTTQYANYLAEVQAVLDANGGGTAVMLEPGQSIPGIVDVDLNSWRIVVQANTMWLTGVGYDQGGPEMINDSNLYCGYQYEIEEDSNFIFSLVIGGVEVVPSGEAWDMSTQEGVDAAVLTVNTFLGANGYATGSLYSLGIFRTNSSPKIICDDVQLTTGIYGPGPTECDYIYEFCDMYACLSRLMNRWMCADPCADKCTTAGETYEEARRKAVELSTMFFHALMPLVSTDRLWYLGNWGVTDQRICNVNNILELYTKMRDYVSNCGFDCGCGCADPCEPCDPCDGQSYQPSLSNPTTPCTGCR